MDHYWKLNAYGKFWENYDNKPIVVLDDPQPPEKFNLEEASTFKQVIGETPCTVEIKYGAMQMDAQLIIILSNFEPATMANSFGLGSSGALYRRFIDTCGAYKCRGPRWAEEKLTKLIATCVQICVDNSVDVDSVVSNLIPYRATDYSKLLCCGGLHKVIQ